MTHGGMSVLSASAHTAPVSDSSALSPGTPSNEKGELSAQEIKDVFKALTTFSRKYGAFKSKYRLTPVVVDLGWVHLHVNHSTIRVVMLGQMGMLQSRLSTGKVGGT